MSSRVHASPGRPPSQPDSPDRFGGHYFDLESETGRLRRDLEWKERVGSSRLVVLDESQAWARGVFSPASGDRYRPRRTGRFLLLGSVPLTLMRVASESLAGRLALAELTPLLWSELDTDARRRRLWSMGGHPDAGVLRPSRYPKWQSDHLDLLDQPWAGSRWMGFVVEQILGHLEPSEREHHPSFLCASDGRERDLLRAGRSTMGHRDQAVRVNAWFGRWRRRGPRPCCLDIPRLGTRLDQ